ncbi:hypothetical protein FHG87_008557 [Trinorchestia longiramus]|nr:hypothetical protein FHG87_008557 [Trinorchestia longiramus]
MSGKIDTVTMKTSLLCLLVLAAVACAKGAAAVNTDLGAGAGGKREARLLGFGYSSCYGPCGGYGCLFDECYSPYDVLFYTGYCACCSVYDIYQCY